ncbi:L-tyrosine/L-tryptophan isonitrile synthase family protein [Phytohabitans rumicis]|uniref:L-tyrosine/L-tryptophan isonitrile synthase family protein n=1 Tax=Phytohabitans rumicis TaxID=1076125 RepID=UPI0015667855|nr:isocyanide synthase family protein [Phytohabitans rumicis]
MTADAPSTAVDRILHIITAQQRFTPGNECAVRPCPRCADVHGAKIQQQMARGEPLCFLLPAFPGKSPNPRKVLGVLPDMAEAVSLGRLDEMCRRIGAVYAPGAQVVICSDGRVFSDAVGIRDEAITAYQRALREMAGRIGPNTLALYHLDDVYPQASHEDMRATLTARYGEDLTLLKQWISEGGELLALYRGITRFLFEDADRPDRQDSRAARQRDSRARAYVVIQRSRAWGELVGRHFPDALRLSIHPQACGAKKLGISLMDATENWLTAWHGVAVDVGGRFLLMKRYHAESLGAELVHRDGRPSHFRLADPSSLPPSKEIQHETTAA